MGCGDKHTSHREYGVLRLFLAKLRVMVVRETLNKGGGDYENLLDHTCQLQEVFFSNDIDQFEAIIAESNRPETKLGGIWNEPTPGDYPERRRVACENFENPPKRGRQRKDNEA